MTTSHRADGEAGDIYSTKYIARMTVCSLKFDLTHNKFVTTPVRCKCIGYATRLSQYTFHQCRHSRRFGRDARAAAAVTTSTTIPVVPSNRLDARAICAAKLACGFCLEVSALLPVCTVRSAVTVLW